jgi:hypothetical protein
MSDILASSITLEDILAVAHQKRVPIAPELAGYLTLELADAVNAGSATAIDPKTVYVSEEGSVAIVKPKGPGDGTDVETQLRLVLSDLLSVTGAQTSALTHVAKKKSGGGVRALASELEAALIPVNRAAGRRALARMAREARRIALGLGRAGALPAPEPRKRESGPDQEQRFNEAPTVQRPRTPFPSEEQVTAKRTATQAAAEPVAAAKLPVPPANRGPAPPPPPVRPPPQKRGPALPEPPALLGPKDNLFKGDEVDNLLSTFGVSGDASDDDKAMSHELKALVGLGPTPPPPGTEANFDDEPAPRDPSEELRTNKLERAPAPPAAPPKAARLPTTDEPTREAPPVLSSKSTLSGMGDSPPVSANFSSGNPSDPGDPGDDLLNDLAANPNAAHAGDGIEDLLSMSDENVIAVRTNDAPMQPIAVATLKKADIQSQPQMRAAKEPPKRAPAPPPPAEATAPAPVSAKAQVAAKVAPSTAVPTGRQPKAPKSTMVFLVLLLLLLGGGAVGVWKLAPGFFTGRTPENLQREKEQYEQKKAALEKAQEEQRCKAALVITDAPAGSEILLRKGQAPVDVERMPIKTRLEFVATAEGFAPRRAVVLPTAPWEQKKPPRFDLAVQLEPSKVKAPALDPWPSGEPGTDVGGEGDPGTVHVVSSPPGAEIWLLAGLGPEARIDRLKCDESVEVLVAGSQIRKRLKVAAGDAAKAPVDSAGFHVVKLGAKAD